MELYEKRASLRKEIIRIWQAGINPWTDYEKAISAELNAVHKKIIEIELLDDNKPNERIAYSVCGWSERQGYFRNKRFLSDNLKEAKNEFDLCKKEPEWNIPTIIVKHTYLRSESSATTDFDGDVNNLGCDSGQELVAKHMCGNKHYRWKNLLYYLNGDYTY